MNKYLIVYPLLPAVLYMFVVSVVACQMDGAAPIPSARPTVLSTEAAKQNEPVLSDLVVAVEGPNSARAGEALQDRITVKITNEGHAAAGSFAVGLYFSSDETVDRRNDRLLIGGREFVKRLGPGETIVVQLNGTNTLPQDAAKGKHYLGVIVDEGNAVQEQDEENNTAYWPITITG